MSKGLIWEDPGIFRLGRGGAHADDKKGSDLRVVSYIKPQVMWGAE